MPFMLNTPEFKHKAKLQNLFVLAIISSLKLPCFLTLFLPFF